MADAPIARSVAILLVDDEDLVRPAVARGLRRAGHTVHEAESAQRALGLLGDRAYAIEVLITDVRMPGIDGAELARRALALRPGIRVLFMSGSPELPDHIRSLPGRLLLKPFRRSDLLAAIDELLVWAG